MNELVTNVAKHGAGRIDVTLKANAGDPEIIVCDQGKRLPVGFDPDLEHQEPWMKVVSALALA